MVDVKKLTTYLKKKSIRAETLHEYEKMVVVGVSNKLGITETDHKKSKDLSKYQLVEPGDFAYNPYRINVGSIGLVPVGVRGLVSPAYVIFSTTDKLISELLLDFLKSSEGLFQIGKYARGTVRKALRFEDLCNIEMPIPTLEKQKNILKKKTSTQFEVEVLERELTYQQTLLKKLRQQILQEAIEGKLTKDWRAENPGIEPASELLKQIQAEKEQLIKDKKTKNQKPLQPVSEEEKSFKLPEGWVWCRLREFSTHYVDCPHDTPKYQGTGFLCLRAPDVTEDGLLINMVRRVSNEEYEKRVRRLKPARNDLVYIREGGRLGIAGLIDTDEPVCLGQRVMMLRFLDEVSAKYSLRFLNAPNTYNDIVGKTIGSAAPHVNVRDIIAHLVPVPPLPEQKAIASKIEKLFTLCDQLEAQITSNQTHVEQLMQAVLKEAFSQPEAA